MTMKKILYLWVLATALLTSCSSGDSASVTADDILVTKSIRTRASDGSVLTTYHTYDGKKAVKSENSNGNYETYTYTGDLLTQVKNYNAADALIGTETFTYNSNNQLVAYVRVDVIGNTGTKETYVYNPDGTVATTSYSGNGVSQTTPSGTGIIVISGGEVVMSQTSTGYMYMYTYDTKNNPFKNITGFDKLVVIGGQISGGIQHNIVTNDNGAGTVFNSVYTYNALNFPLTATKTEGTTASSTITTQYFYND